MKSDRQVPVAIIGGGFSGTILAAQLARRGIDSVLVEGMGLAGKGAAYSTTEPAHLLNVQAEWMSAWPDKASDFAERFSAVGGERSGFAERRLFGLYVGEILNDIAMRPYVTVGFTAFVLMIPLAITSTKKWISRLGGKRWQALHRLVYVSAIAGVLHYLWLVKLDIRSPVRYGIAVGLLLLFRVWLAFRGKPAVTQAFRRVD